MFDLIEDNIFVLLSCDDCMVFDGFYVVELVICDKCLVFDIEIEVGDKVVEFYLLLFLFC